MIFTSYEEFPKWFLNDSPMRVSRTVPWRSELLKLRMYIWFVNYWRDGGFIIWCFSGIQFLFIFNFGSLGYEAFKTGRLDSIGVTNYNGSRPSLPSLIFYQLFLAGRRQERCRLCYHICTTGYNNSSRFAVENFRKCYDDTCSTISNLTALLHWIWKKRFLESSYRDL